MDVLRSITTCSYAYPKKVWDGSFVDENDEYDYLAILKIYEDSPRAFKVLVSHKGIVWLFNWCCLTDGCRVPLFPIREFPSASGVDELESLCGVGCSKDFIFTPCIFISSKAQTQSSRSALVENESADIQVFSESESVEEMEVPVEKLLEMS